jgi:hypothetical protein
MAQDVAAIELFDVHPLYGGQKIYLLANGTGYCQIVFRESGSIRLSEKRYRVALTREETQDLVRLVSDHDFHSLRSSEKPGLPDSVRRTILVRTGTGRSYRVSRWLHDTESHFDAIYEALVRIARSVRSENLILKEQYDPAWVPEGFRFD